MKLTAPLWKFVVAVLISVLAACTPTPEPATSIPPTVATTSSTQPTTTTAPTSSTGGTVRIHDIQGSSHLSPLKDKSVSGVPGVVTALASNGFYLQDPTPDSNDATSEAILVFTKNAPTVKVGDSVTVGGTVQEFRPGGNSGTNNLTITELGGNVTVSTVSSGNQLPAPIVIGRGGRVPPDKVIKDNATGDIETSTAFDPAHDGMDFYESLEAMRVQVNNAVAVSPTNDFGEVFVVGDNGTKATVSSPRGGVVSSADDYNPERIMLSDALIQSQSKMPKLNVGDKFTSPVVGLMSYDFSNYDVLLTAAPQTASGNLTKETTTAAGSDQLAIATFNVENLSPSDPASKFNNLATLIANNLKAPDIIAVEEIQDNSGSKDDGVVDANQTVGKLIAAIQAAGGPTYDYRLINPDNAQDGGQPGGNIRQGFLFNAARVNFADRPGGTSTAATTVSSVGGQVVFSFSPGRIDPQNAAWQNSRKPLVGKFVYNNQSVFVIAVHFNSKGGDQPLFGRFQTPALSSESQRLNQGVVVRNFVKQILDIDANANIVVLGDFNDSEFSKVITTLKSDMLDNLVDTLPKNERYSYVFEGNSQILDQVLVSHNITKNAAVEYDIVHINAEFAVQASDHDPSVARLRIK